RLGWSSSPASPSASPCSAPTCWATRCAIFSTPGSVHEPAFMTALLEVENLGTWFYTRQGIVKAVDGVQFQVASGETLAIVGESGCGKSMTALSLMRLIPDPPGRIVSGTVKLAGRNLLDLSEEQMRKVRGNDISMIFQEPMTSLNPVM